MHRRSSCTTQALELLVLFAFHLDFLLLPTHTHILYSGTSTSVFCVFGYHYCVECSTDIRNKFSIVLDTHPCPRDVAARALLPPPSRLPAPFARCSFSALSCISSRARVRIISILLVFPTKYDMLFPVVVVSTGTALRGVRHSALSTSVRALPHKSWKFCSHSFDFFLCILTHRRYDSHVRTSYRSLDVLEVSGFCKPFHL